MTKRELVERMADSAGITKVAAEKALNGFLDGIKKSLAKRQKVTLVGFGTFGGEAQKGRAEEGEEMEAVRSFATWLSTEVREVGKVFGRIEAKLAEIRRELRKDSGDVSIQRKTERVEKPRLGRHSGKSQVMSRLKVQSVRETT